MSSITVSAYAKINLALYVLGKRADGFHEISTLLQAIDLYDSIRFEVTDSGLAMTSAGLPLSTGDDNLILRAVRILEEETGADLRLQVHLEKRIPVGAGLGGGSSDAAATLWAVNSLYRLGLSREKLDDLAGQLGSDVPFFLSAGQALAEGRGDKLTELAWPLDYHIVLVFPGVFVSAREGYANTRISLTNPLAQHKIRRSLGPEIFWNWLRSQTNDLTEGVVGNRPEVAACLRAVRDLGAHHACMSGSGSAVFGLFLEPLSEDAFQTLAMTDGWSAFRTQPLRAKEGSLPALVRGT